MAVPADEPGTGTWRQAMTSSKPWTGAK